MAEIPFWKGKDAKLLFIFEANKLLVDHVDFEVGIEGDDIEDDVCGEDRARLDFVASHYSVVLNAMQTKTDQITAFINSQKTRDQRAVPKISSMGILIYPNNGTQAAFQCRDYILGKWKMKWSGRKARNSLAIPGRCKYFDVLPTL